MTCKAREGKRPRFFDNYWGNTAIAFSPDSKQLAPVSYSENIQLWDAATGAALQTLKDHMTTTIAFSPDGKRLASVSNNGVQLWDTSTGAALQTLRGHTRNVTSIAFSPDSKRLALASNNETVRLLDTATGAQRQIFQTNATVNTLTFSIDGSRLQINRGVIPMRHSFPTNIPIQPTPATDVFVKDQ